VPENLYKFNQIRSQSAGKTQFFFACGEQ